jgi:hypothetical protein
MCHHSLFLPSFFPSFFPPLSWWHWVLNSGLCVCYPGSLSLEPAPSPFCFSCFVGRVLHIVPRLSWTVILLPTPPALLGSQAGTSMPLQPGNFRAISNVSMSSEYPSSHPQNPIWVVNPKPHVNINLKLRWTNLSYRLIFLNNGLEFCGCHSWHSL